MTTGVKMSKMANNIIRIRLYNIVEVCKPDLASKKAKFLELMKEKAQIATKSDLARKIRDAKGYYALEIAPPHFNEMQKLKSDVALVKEFIKSGCFKHLTVKQAFLLFLVGLEVSLWFFLGETIGKMHLVGYEV